MVSEKKRRVLQEIVEDMKKHKVVGIVDMNKLPARQLLELRGSLRGKAFLRMAKKRVITRALKESGLEGLTAYNASMPTLLFSNENPFKLARLISESKSPAPAKAGEALEKDVVVQAGPTSIAAGPAISGFQKFKIPVAVEGGKISVRADTTVGKRGDKVSAALASLLQKLSINPMEIGLNLLAAHEKGTVYPKDILFVPQELHLGRLKQGHHNAFALAMSIGYVTKDNIKLLLAKADRGAQALSLKAGFVTADTAIPLLARGAAEAAAIETKTKPVASGTPAEGTKAGPAADATAGPPQGKGPKPVKKKKAGGPKPAAA